MKSADAQVVVVAQIGNNIYMVPVSPGQNTSQPWNILTLELQGHRNYHNYLGSLIQAMNDLNRCRWVMQVAHNLDILLNFWSKVHHPARSNNFEITILLS